MSKIILIGGGGHCKSAIDVIEQEARFEIAGIIDKPELLGSKILGYPVIGNDLDLEKLAKKYFENGKLYLKIKKFESAMYYFDIVISDYYDTKYSDESKISYIFTYILMKDYNRANEYFLNNKATFKESHKLNEAEEMLNEYKDGIGLSGYYRLYK